MNASLQDEVLVLFFIYLISNNISDSKQQQTTTVDYKRLINGFVLTNVVSLPGKYKLVEVWQKKTTNKLTQEMVIANCDNPEAENMVQNEKEIERLIYVVRERQVMFDRDLAKLYQVETGQLNRQVKRNIERFPSDFMFQLTKEEVENLKCQNGIASWGKRCSVMNALVAESMC